MQIRILRCLCVIMNHMGHRPRPSPLLVTISDSTSVFIRNSSRSNVTLSRVSFFAFREMSSLRNFTSKSRLSLSSLGVKMLDFRVFFSCSFNQVLSQWLMVKPTNFSEALLSALCHSLRSSEFRSFIAGGCERYSPLGGTPASR